MRGSRPPPSCLLEQQRSALRLAAGGLTNVQASSRPPTSSRWTKGEA